MNQRTRIALQVGLTLGFIALGAASFVAMTTMSGGAEQSEVSAPPAAVEVMRMAPRDVEAVVEATGTVEAANRVDLVAQVSGRIVWTAPGLAPGERFARGALLARIDPRDFEAAEVQQRAQVRAAELEVSLEEARAEQVQREFALLGQDPSSPLALRQPQLEAARARLASARAALDQAKLNLERTELRAPLDAVVGSESLEVGQLVGPGAPVASLLGVDTFRVRAAVPVRQLAWLEIPTDDGERGARAVVTQELGRGRSISAEGYVSGRLGELDPQTRTASLLVRLPNPLDVGPDQLPILPGAYVQVRLHGRQVPGVYEVPRVALVDGAQVLVADEDQRLRRRELDIAWGTPDHVYATSGLSPGDRVLLTHLSLPIEGMPLSVSETVADLR